MIVRLDRTSLSTLRTLFADMSILASPSQQPFSPVAMADTGPPFTLSAQLLPGRPTPRFHIRGVGDVRTLAAQLGLVWDETARAYTCPTAYHARMLWCYADAVADGALARLFPKLHRPIRPIRAPYLLAANDRLICVANAESKARIQAQGFRYDEQYRYWWTQDLRRALPLIDIAEPPLAARLKLASSLPLEGLGNVTIGDLIALETPEEGSGSSAGSEEESDNTPEAPTLLFDNDRQLWVCDHPVAKASGFRQQGGLFVSRDFEHAARLREHATPDAELRMQAEAMIRYVPSPLEAFACRDPVPVPPTAPGALGAEQLACVHFCRSRSGAINADDMGVGKTAESIGQINATRPRRALVIAPASLVPNWMDECRMWLMPPMHAAVLTSKDVALPDATVVIVSYDALPRLIDMLTTVEWDLLFTDEGTRIKNDETRAGKLIYRILVPRARVFIDLTGTPIWNRPQDLYAPLHAIAPLVFPSKKRFRQLYGISDAHNLTPRQRQRLDFLAHLLKSGLMIRRLKSDVLDLPSKSHEMMDLSQIPTVMLDALRARDQELREALLAEIARQVGADVAEQIRNAGGRSAGAAVAAAQDAGALTKRSRSVFAEIARLRLEVGQVKLPFVRDQILRTWRDTGEPPVIFGKHRKLLRQFATDLLDAGMRVELLTGEMSASKRQPAVKRFQAGAADGVVASYDAAGVGFTLTRSNWVTMYELDVNPPLMSQAIDRLHRRGQRRPVRCAWAAIDGTIDSHIASLYLAKDGIARDALGDHLVGMFDPAELLKHPVFTDPAADEMLEAA